MKALKYVITLFMLFAEIVVTAKTHTNMSADGDDVYIIVEQMPIFPGGDEALRNFVTNNVQYPEEAHKNGISGRVFICFVVGKDGSVQDVKVARSINPLLDAEAIRVVKSMPKWTPGQHRGKPVKVSYTIPINFSLK